MSRKKRQQTRQEKQNKSALRNRLFTFKRVMYGSLALIVLGSFYAFVHLKGVERLEQSVAMLLEKIALSNGVRLENIVVEGRHNTSTQEISKALSVRRGVHLWGLDVHCLRERLIDLPWVRSAIVQRRFPDTLYVRLTERTPVALWQDKGKIYLIDDQGSEIMSPSLAKHHSLLRVSGEGAPERAPEIVEKLRLFPSLKKRLRGAVLNGGRQWDLFLGKGLRINLPEEQMEEALTYLTTLVETGHLDNPKIKSIDVRLSDRTFFYLDQDEIKKHKVSFQHQQKAKNKQ